MNIHVVLVRSEYASNVGATARAMANMGAGRLILVDPRCDFSDERAREMAAGAQEQLRRAITYKSWTEFFASEGEGVRLALTRRGGRNRKVFALEDKVRELAANATALETTGNLYLIFGPEADGLDSEDMAYANFMVHLPVFGDFASYNLAQAVLLTLYIVRQTLPPLKIPSQLTGEVCKPVQPFYFPDKLIREWLTVMGFDVNARRASAYLTLRRLFLQNLPTKHELHVLESILQQNIRKLKANALFGFASEKLADDSRDITR